MGVEKLSDGIRKFAADAIKLETMIKVRGKEREREREDLLFLTNM